jgi:hypothetical protein
MGGVFRRVFFLKCPHHRSFFVGLFSGNSFVYYESMKRELKTRPIYECRCDERPKSKAEESARLAYTGLLSGSQTFFLLRESGRGFR